MITQDAKPSEKLAQARELFEGLLDHYEESNKLRRRAKLMFHNTNGQGQWDSADREYLEDEGRPVLSFNIAKNKIDAVQGMLEDVRQVPMVRPAGKEDTFVAEVHTALLDRAREMIDAESLEWEVAETALIEGDGALALDVHPDPKNPARLQFEAKPVEPHEVLWDNASIRPGREDAEYVFWARWYTLAEFKATFPEFADRAEEFVRGGAYEAEMAETSVDNDTSEAGTHYRTERDYDESPYMGQYRDRKKNQIRVIHMEYVCPKQKHFLLMRESGISQEVSAKQAKLFETIIELEGKEDIEVVKAWDNEVYALDFIRNEILFDDQMPLPISGFSIVPFTCFYDTADNTTYGLMRNLMDPQREFNKAHSQNLETNIGQSKPGYLAEIGAVPNPDEFESQNAQAGGIAWVNDGALAANRIQERQVPTVSPAGAKRMEDSLMLIDRIAGIGTDLEKGGVSGAEALGTVQLRYRRAQIAMRKIFKNFERFQRNFAGKMLEAIARSYPDHQITAMLGDSERFVLEQGRVAEIVPGPDGQPQPGRIAALRDLRNKPMDIELDTGTANNTLRLMELQTLAALANQGTEVDPTIMVEKAVASRSDRERLLEYIKQRQAAAAQGAQQEADQLANQVAAGFDLQQRELEEKKRHNVAEESLEAREQQIDASVEFAKLAEKANADERKMIEEARARVEASQYERGA